MVIKWLYMCRCQWRHKVEAKTLMLSVNNILSAAHGKPLCRAQSGYYPRLLLSDERAGGARGEGKLFANPQEVRVAYDTG
jgi:DNA-directed RNA polymerase subunit beta'